MKSKRSTHITAGVAVVLIIVAVYFLFFFRKSTKVSKPQDTASDIKDLSSIETAKRPFVTLTPTTDGAEVIISIENMSTFDKIEYELTYQADNPTIVGEKIQRGATGTDVNTKDAKYKKSVLLGTASRGVRSPDRGVTDGKLTMHYFKGDSEFQSETFWDLEQIGLTASTLKSKDANFQLDLPALGKNYWAILSDTIGVPQGGSFDVKNVTLPVIGAFAVAPDFTKPADVTVKINQSVKSADLYFFGHADSAWQKLQSSLSGSTLTAKVSSFGTFVTVSSK